MVNEALPKPEDYEELSKTFASLGVSCEEAAEAFSEMAKYLPPYTEEDILRVRMNPSLSMLDKFRIIRSMRKEMRKG